MLTDIVLVLLIPQRTQIYQLDELLLAHRIGWSRLIMFSHQPGCAESMLVYRCKLALRLRLELHIAMLFKQGPDIFLISIEHHLLVQWLQLCLVP